MNETLLAKDIGMNIFVKSFILVILCWVLIYVCNIVVSNTQIYESWYFFYSFIQIPGLLLFSLFYPVTIHAIDSWQIVLTNVFFYYFLTAGSFFAWKKIRQHKQTLHYDS